MAATTSPTLSWGGTISGPRYLLAGIVLFLSKFAIDHALAAYLFGRPWSVIDYLAPGLNAPGFFEQPADRAFFGTMMLVALPFMCVGLVLTVRRLRAAALPRWLVVLFFAPVVNVFYFLLLTVIPSRQKSETDAAGVSLPVPVETVGVAPAAPPAAQLDYGVDDVREPAWMRWFPESASRSAWVAALLPLPAVAGLTLLATFGFGDYGFGLFIGMPFLVGLIAALVHGVRVRRTIWQSLRVATYSVLLCGAALILLALEGAFCLLMLMPLAWGVALLGATLGHALQTGRPPPDTAYRAIGVMLLAVPLFMGAEHVSPPTARTHAVTSFVIVNAPPEVVWRHVIAFPPLPEPREWEFRAGVAYPVRAEIDGSGPGAVRRCVFSTGAFVEPIEVWDEPRVLKFAVTENPPPLRERSLYDIHPPHLHGFLTSDAGQFTLTELPGGRTRLEGTTWYRQRLWPEAYWRFWSDRLIGRIHLRVLRHIKNLSETTP